jgi:hypothetical protein
MPLKTITANFVLCFILLAAAPFGYAQEAPRRHPTPWPIWHWHQHQPTRAELRAMHEHDVTLAEAREINRLYMQLEGKTPNIGQNNPDIEENIPTIISPEKNSR